MDTNANEMKTVITNIPTNLDPIAMITDVNMDVNMSKGDCVLSNNLLIMNNPSFTRIEQMLVLLIMYQ